MLKCINQFMCVDFKLILEKEPKRIPDDIRPYLHLYKKEDWFLSKDYTFIRIYASQSTPYIFPKLLIPRIFVFEYLRKLEEVDEIHFLKSKKKSRMNFPIVMGGYAIHDRRA